MADTDVRALLESKRAELERELEGLVQVPRDPMATVSFGKRIGDGTTEAVERLNRTAAAQSLSTSLEEVERALEKLDEGSYGVCDDCGEEIPMARLEALPTATTCVTCAEAREVAARSANGNGHGATYRVTMLWETEDGADEHPGSRIAVGRGGYAPAVPPPRRG